MVLRLVPIVAGAALYGIATQEESGEYHAGGGGRQIDAHQIYEQIRSGPGTPSLVEGQQAANTLQATFGDRVEQIEMPSRRMDEAWDGDAAAAAKAGAHPLKKWLEDSRGKLQDSDHYLGVQTDAFATAHSRIRPVSAKPPESDIINDVVPWETDTDRAIQDYNSTAQANVDAFNQYYETSRQNAESMPTYSALDGDIGDDKKGPDREDIRGGPYPGEMPDSLKDDPPPGNSVPTSPGPNSLGPTPQNPSTPGPSTPGPNAPAPTPQNPNTPGPDSPGLNSLGPTPRNPTTPSPYLPGPNGPGDHDGFGPGNPGTPAEREDSTSPSGLVPPSTTVPNATGPGGPGGPGSPGGPSGSGGYGSGGSGAGGYGPGAGTGALPGSGASTGAATPGAAGSAAGAGTAGRAGATSAAGGRAGVPMGGMGGGRGGQGSEDEEHETKYLVAEDGDSVFGTDEMTAPPVIGE